MRVHGQEQQRERGTHAAKLTCALVLIAGCRVDAGDVGGAFYNGDRRDVHCAINLDEKIGNIDTVEGALDRAVETGDVVELYSHKPGASLDDPGVTLTVANLERVLAGAQERGLSFVTYAEMADGVEAHPGVALSFDDAFIAQWWELRPLFRQYGARATFFISRYDKALPEARVMVAELAADGHDIAAHSILHLRAPTYVEEKGLSAYVEDEALPSIQLLRDEGYPVTSFAYPYGARTSELDDALLNHVKIVRTVAFALQGVIDPCPH